MFIRMFDPVTNEVILDDILPNESAKSLKGIWYLDLYEEPHVRDMELREKECEIFLSDFNKEGTGNAWPFFAIEQFLLEYDDPDLQVIRHSSSMVSHGMGGTVVWYVVDKDVVVEQESWGGALQQPDK